VLLVTVLWFQFVVGFDCLAVLIGSFLCPYPLLFEFLRPNVAIWARLSAYWYKP